MIQKNTKFNRKQFNMDAINIANARDRHYHDNRYIISASVTNAIGGKFLVYADDLTQAIEYLAEYYDNHELFIFFDALFDTPAEDEENIYLTDYGYIDLSRFHFETI